MTPLPKDDPNPRKYLERIGSQEYHLLEARLDVFDHVRLWTDNPRLLPYLAGRSPGDEDELEAMLKDAGGYTALRNSIRDLGQLEPIYVWRPNREHPKYVVIEGATRVTVLRELWTKYEGQADRDRFRFVTAKVLPEEFGRKERAILLAQKHVRGTGVRNWGRYVQAKFIHDQVESDPPVLTLTEMANHMGKSPSWASRLRDAYRFSKQFVDWVDAPDGDKLALRQFSTLEEISKSTGFGPRVRAKTEEGDQLRGEVFDMVKNDVFKEYRDARFMAKYFEDPEKWNRLRSHEKHAAHELYNEIRAGQTGVKSRVRALYGQLERALQQRAATFDQEDIDRLQACVDLLMGHVAGDIGPFRMRLNQLTKALYGVPLEEVLAITPEEYSRLRTGLEDLDLRLDRHASWRKDGA